MTESIVMQFAVSLPFTYLIKIAHKDVHIYNEENNQQQKKQLHGIFTLHLKQRPNP